MSRLLHRCTLLAILFASFGIARPTLAQQARFVQLADGSGVQDTQTGLIWGYALADVDRFLTNDQAIRDWSSTLTMEVISAPNGQGGYTSIRYQDFSNAWFGRQDTDWRIPTKDEIIQALDGGLLLALDGSPAAGFQAFDPTADWSWWSSTSAGKVRGTQMAYSINILDGSVHAYSVLSYLYGSVPVRGVAPPPPPSNGGKK